MRLGGLKTRSGRCGKNKYFFLLPGREARPSSPHLSQCRLSYPGSYIVRSMHRHIRNKMSSKGGLHCCCIHHAFCVTPYISMLETQRIEGSHHTKLNCLLTEKPKKKFWLWWYIQSKCHECRPLRGRRLVSDVLNLYLFIFMYTLFTYNVNGTDCTGTKCEMITDLMLQRCGWKPYMLFRILSRKTPTIVHIFMSKMSLVTGLYRPPLLTQFWFNLFH